MEGDRRDLCAARAAGLQNLGREVQSRGGRGHRSAFAREDRLVAFAVGGGSARLI